MPELCSQCHQENVFLQPNKKPFWLDARNKAQPLGEKCARAKVQAAMAEHMQGRKAEGRRPGLTGVQEVINTLNTYFSGMPELDEVFATLHQVQNRVRDRFEKGYLTSTISDVSRIAPWLQLQGTLLFLSEGEKEARKFKDNDRAKHIINDLREVRAEAEKRLPENPGDPTSRWPQLSEVDRRRYTPETLLERALRLRNQAKGLESEAQSREQARAAVDDIFGKLYFAPVAQSSSEPEITEEEEKSEEQTSSLPPAHAEGTGEEDQDEEEPGEIPNPLERRRSTLIPTRPSTGQTRRRQQ